MPEMTPRERVLAALNHQEPDKVPMDFGGIESSLHRFAHQELMRHLGLEGPEPEIRSYVSYSVEPDPRLIDLFGRDILPFRTKSGGRWKLHIDPETRTWVDEWGTTYRKPVSSHFSTSCAYPLAGAETVSDLEGYPLPDAADPARMEGLTEAIKEAAATGDTTILMASGTLGMWLQTCYLRGWEQAFIDMVVNPALAEALAERILRWHLDYWGMVLGLVGPYLDVVQLEGDLGNQTGPLFSPALFRRVYKPMLRRLIDFIKKRTPAKILLHSCGSIYWAIPDLIDCGVDALNPVQVNAREMEDTTRLKREFGRDLVFWGGGCDPVLLQYGSPQEVEAEVKKRMDDLALDGGFVFTSVHSIVPGVPPQNIVALYQTARRYGGYS